MLGRRSLSRQPFPTWAMTHGLHIQAVTKQSPTMLKFLIMKILKFWEIYKLAMTYFWCAKRLVLFISFRDHARSFMYDAFWLVYIRHPVSFEYFSLAVLPDCWFLGSCLIVVTFVWHEAKKNIYNENCKRNCSIVMWRKRGGWSAQKLLEFIISQSVFIYWFLILIIFHFIFATVKNWRWKQYRLALKWQPWGITSTN